MNPSSMTCEEFTKMIMTVSPKDLQQRQAIEVCLHMDSCEACRVRVLAQAIEGMILGNVPSQKELDEATEVGRNAAKAYFQGGVN
jgi:hypothetical protein